jgi:hypothetical protein
VTRKLVAAFLIFSAAIPTPIRAQGYEEVAAAAAVVSIGLKIASMFSDSANAKTQQAKLDTISRQIAGMKLDEINRQLGSITIALAEIGVKMDTIAETEQRKKVDARIITIVNNYVDWAARTDRTDARMQFDDLENENNNLMTRSSFANYQSVALAMYIEDSMMVLLKKPDDVRNAVFTRYQNYFISATDAKVESSIAYELRAKQVQLDASTDALNNPKFAYFCFVGGQIAGCCGDGVACWSRDTQWSVGNVDTAFYMTGSAGRRVTGPGGDNNRCRTNSGDRGQGGRQNFLGKRLTYEMLASPPPPDLPEKYACPADLEPLRVAHTKLVKERDVLAAALANAKQFATIASGLKERANLAQDNLHNENVECLDHRGIRFIAVSSPRCERQSL